ncbi:chemotaxis protein CheD [Primorskyibacter flagellatus]|nr:chemotaxis protein CheD [Primorskyibacter flagellatus]
MTGRQISITQGEFAVSAEPGSVISTILGSCVSTCLWDEAAHVGGMNHILVAQVSVGGVDCDFAGVNAMELLINGLIRRGANRANLRAKVFGGARMISGLSDIGDSNGRFALDFLSREGIPCIGHSIGGASARHIRFFPTEGRVMQKTVAPVKDLIEVPAQSRVERNGVELF